MRGVGAHWGSDRHQRRNRSAIAARLALCCRCVPVVVRSRVRHAARRVGVEPHPHPHGHRRVPLRRRGLWLGVVVQRPRRAGFPRRHRRVHLPTEMLPRPGCRPASRVAIADLAAVCIGGVSGVPQHVCIPEFVHVLPPARWCERACIRLQRMAGVAPWDLGAREEEKAETEQ